MQVIEEEGLCRRNMAYDEGRLEEEYSMVVRNNLRRNQNDTVTPYSGADSESLGRELPPNSKYALVDESRNSL